jgi:hypothetical protein
MDYAKYIEKFEKIDRGYLAMSYILLNTPNMDIRDRGLEKFYDREERKIRLEALNYCLCCSSEALVKISFNLFNGFVPSEEGEETGRNDINSLFWNLDQSNIAIVLRAMEIRYLEKPVGHSQN